MTRLVLLRCSLLGLTAVFAVAIVACGDDLGLPPATTPNVVDTTTLFALRGTPIRGASAYDIVGRRVSRTDLGDPFDFAFDMDPDGNAFVAPGTRFGLSSDAGILISEEPFDSVLTAPTEGFESDTLLQIDVETVFVARSRSSTQLCSFLGALPRYGKFRVLALNLVDRTVTFELLVNLNCGYRSLEPGLPTS